MKLSFTKIKMFMDCGKKYDLHYNKKLRAVNTHGALLFGNAIDRAINHLLTTNKLDEAKNIFQKTFRFSKINNVETYIPSSDKVVFSKADFDKDLMFDEDVVKIVEQVNKWYYNLGLPPITDKDISQIYSVIIKKKEEHGFKNLTKTERQIYATCNWFCMKNKGLIMLDSYNKFIVPKIKKVISVQKTIYLDNGVGDKLQSILDLVIEWQDGKRYVIDNKTSAMKYEKDSAMKSPQLMGYYHAVKNEYNIDGGVGFIVMYKQLLKNKVKICSLCKFDGTGTRYKTCNNDLHVSDSTKRCNGEWIETIRPEAFIDVILNPVTTTIENLVLHTYDEATKRIKEENYGPNLNSCGNENFRCQYFQLCYHDDKSDLIDLSKEEKDEKA